MEYLSKSELWVKFGFFLYSSFFRKNDARSTSFTLPLSFELVYKLVCIHANPNNSRMLLNSKLMRIRFWQKKKQLNMITAFFTLQ